MDKEEKGCFNRQVNILGSSVSLGIGLPMIFDNLPYKNILIPPVNEVEILPADLKLNVEQLENEQFYYPIQFNLSFRYNFKSS